MLSRFPRLQRLSTGWVVTLIAIGWLVLISWFHWLTNFETHDRPVMRMGYMPVVTNLACPLLDYASKEGTGLRFEALKFLFFCGDGRGFAERDSPGRIHDRSFVGGAPPARNRRAGGTSAIGTKVRSCTART